MTYTYNEEDHMTKDDKKKAYFCENYCDPLSPSQSYRDKTCGGKREQSKCSPASGCKWDEDKDKCTINNEISLANAYLSGGFGFGKVCLPTKNITNLLVLFVYPPLFIFIQEYKKGFKNIGAIVLSFALTTMFYFPGLIHGLHYMMGKDYCSAIGDVVGVGVIPTASTEDD